MAFEAFPSDAVEAFNDPGIYYVHENGKLRSPPGLGPSSHSATLSECGLPKLSSFDLGENYDGSSCFVPRSLFMQTINFVARNLWRVESLVGFPDIVGKQLFDAAASQGVFSNKHLRLTSLRLFVEAYSIEILSSLTITKNPKVLEEYLDEITLFSGLQELELEGIPLGEEHKIWPQIGNMPSLWRLGLGKTGVTDGVLQRLTTPLRLMGRGPSGLKVFDLSGNAKLTDKSIRFLKVVRHLDALDITGCCFSPHGIKQLHNEMCLRRLEDNEIDDKGLDAFCRSVENIGWASKVVEDWIGKTKVAVEKTVPKGCPKARKFYSSSNSRLGFLDANITETTPQVLISSRPYIRLVRDTKVRDEARTNREWNTDQSDVREALQKECGPGKSIRPQKVTNGLQCQMKNDHIGDTMGTSGDCVLKQSNSKPKSGSETSTASGPQSFSAFSGKGYSTGHRSPGLKVKLKRKRKRNSSDDELRKVGAECGFEEDDKDLMSSYLNIRTDGDVNLDKVGDKSKLMRAMDSSNW